MNTIYTNGVNSIAPTVILDLAEVEGMAQYMAQCGYRSKVLTGKRSGTKIRLTYARQDTLDYLLNEWQDGALVGLWTVETKGIHTFLIRTDKPTDDDPTDPTAAPVVEETTEDEADIFDLDLSPSWEKGDDLLIEQYSERKSPANFEESRAGVKSRNWFSAGESEYPNTKTGRAKAYRHARRLALGEWFSMGDKSAKIGYPTRIRHGAKVLWTGGEEFMPESPEASGDEATPAETPVTIEDGIEVEDVAAIETTMPKSWLVDYRHPVSGEWFPCTRYDAGKPMRAGYPTKRDALRKARNLADGSSSLKVRVVACLDHPGVQPFPPIGWHTNFVIVRTLDGAIDGIVRFIEGATEGKHRLATGGIVEASVFESEAAAAECIDDLGGNDGHPFVSYHIADYRRA